jgi:hypothetical protein
VGLLAGRSHARLRDLRLRRAHGAPPRRPRFRRGRSASGPARLPRRPARHERSVHACGLSRLAVRRARPAGPRDRPGAGCGERRSPRSASAARSRRRRADQRRGQRRRHRPWCPRLGDAGPAAPGPSRAALRRAVRPLRRRLCRRAAHARAGHGPVSSPPHPAAPEYSLHRAAAVPPRLARGAFVVVGRWPVPVPRSAIVGKPVRHDEPRRDRHKRVRSRGLWLGGAARVRPPRAVGRRRGWVGGARRWDRDHRARRRDGVRRPAAHRLGDRRGGVRPRIPRRPARTVGRHPARPPRGGHVGLLRRGLPVAFGPRGARWGRRDPAGARIDVRDSRERRGHACAGCGRRGVAHAAAARGARTRALRRDSGRAPPRWRDAPRRPRFQSPARVGRSAGAGRG